MQTVEIDFDVFKALTAMRTSERHTFNEVLRQLLNLPTMTALSADEQSKRRANIDSQGATWHVRNVTFPPGTEFRAIYKGTTYTASIRNGALFVQGKRAVNPSYAANIITGNNVNGWRFWEARLPGHSDWRKLDTFRRLNV